MAQITYDDKSFLNENPSIPDVNKVTDDDINEIKSVVNENDNDFQSYTNKAMAMYGVSNTSLSFTTTEAYGAYTIPLNLKKVSINDTNKFIFDSNAHTITIGAGITKIKLSAQLAINRGDGNYLNIYVCKGINTNVIAQGSCYFSDWCSSSPVITGFLLEVQEGDVLYLRVGTGGGANKTFQFSYPDRMINLTLEEIK